MDDYIIKIIKRLIYRNLDIEMMMGYNIMNVQVYMILEYQF